MLRFRLRALVLRLAVRSNWKSADRLPRSGWRLDTHSACPMSSPHPMVIGGAAPGSLEGGPRGCRQGGSGSSDAGSKTRTRPSTSGEPRPTWPDTNLVKQRTLNFTTGAAEVYKAVDTSPLSHQNRPCPCDQRAGPIRVSGAARTVAAPSGRAGAGQSEALCWVWSRSQVMSRRVCLALAAPIAVLTSFCSSGGGRTAFMPSPLIHSSRAQPVLWYRCSSSCFSTSL